MKFTIFVYKVDATLICISQVVQALLNASFPQDPTFVTGEQIALVEPFVNRVQNVMNISGGHNV